MASNALTSKRQPDILAKNICG